MDDEVGFGVLVTTTQYQSPIGSCAKNRTTNQIGSNTEKKALKILPFEAGFFLFVQKSEIVFAFLKRRGRTSPVHASGRAGTMVDTCRLGGDKGYMFSDRTILFWGRRGVITEKRDRISLCGAFSGRGVTMIPTIFVATTRVRVLGPSGHPQMTCGTEQSR